MAIDWERVALGLLHPIQIEVLKRCDVSSRSPSQIADALGMPVGRVSYHVRQLTSKGLLILVDQQPRRGAVEHFYIAAPSVQRQRRTHAVEHAA